MGGGGANGPSDHLLSSTFAFLTLQQGSQLQDGCCPVYHTVHTLICHPPQLRQHGGGGGAGRGRHPLTLPLGATNPRFATTYANILGVYIIDGVLRMQSI